MNEVLLVGASGWLGQYIGGLLPDVTPVSAESVLASRGAVLRPLLEGREGVLVNAAGARQGAVETMLRVNADLPRILAQEVARFSGHLVHLGSAAEYGLGQRNGICDEGAVAAPESDYGRTKLTGTELVLASGASTVLRVFNIAAYPPQEGSPLADIAERVRCAIATGVDVPLLSAGTVRDWVNLTFLYESIHYAIQNRPVGLFNICSGIGVKIGDAVEEALKQLAPACRVRDLKQTSRTTIIGVPHRWTATSGLSDPLGVSEIAEVLMVAASDRGFKLAGEGEVTWKL